MKETQIDFNWLTKPTGDPFADVGGLVIKYLYEQPQLKNKTVLELIEYVTKIYVENWEGKLNAFFLNSTITQPAFKGQRKIEETLKFYKGIITESSEYKIGYCRILGEKTKLFRAGRDNHILSGSGTFINFHHNLEEGIMLSKEALIRTFFVPFGLLQLGDKVALVYSNNEVVTAFFVNENCKNNLQELATGQGIGILKSDFNNPSNALFAFVDKCLRDIPKAVDYDEGNEDFISRKDTYLNLLHFTNFGASPEIQLFSLPATVFRFYATCHQVKYRKDWQKFIYSNYKSSKYKDAHFNESNEQWESKKENLAYDSYRIWRNLIYEKLLNNQSILSQFLYWSVKHPFPFNLIETYQVHLRNMDKRTIQKIKDLAEFIVTGRGDDVIKKSVTKLNGMKTGQDLRQFLLKLIAENHNQQTGKLLISLEEYVEYLFPDGIFWREIRDLLLIAVYQKLHENNIKVEVEYTDTEEEIETETN
jgi:CRISPR-associated protein Cst1